MAAVTMATSPGVNVAITEGSSGGCKPGGKKHRWFMLSIHTRPIQGFGQLHTTAVYLN